jgi:hypothetical protein
MASSETHIERATISDFDELTAMMDEANEYSRAKSGEPAWKLKDLALRELAEHLKAGDCFVMKVDQKIVATMTITDSDSLWGESGADGTALYMHKLMKHADCPVPDVGLAFLSFTAHKAQELKRTVLRCDTITTQERLIDYYIRLGFVIKKHFTYYPSERPGVFMEASVGDILERFAKTAAKRP